MKKFVIIFLTGITFSYTLNAQIQMYDIYTPNCNPVTTWLMTESALSVRLDFDAQYAVTYPLAKQIETHKESGYSISSTRKFNCHGHAWLREENGPDRWIGLGNTTDEDIYMSDMSYAKVSTPTHPGKISWGSDNHSAVTTPTSGVFISKWGEGPLMRHAWNDSPFNSSNLKYYVKNSPHIFDYANSIVYDGGTGFTLVNPPACSGTTNWTLSNTAVFSFSPSSSVTSTSSKSVTVYKTGVYLGGWGTLTAYNAGTNFTVTINATIAISGPSSMNCGYSETWTLPYVSGYTYQWYSGYLLEYLYDYGNSATYRAPSWLAQDEYDVIYCKITPPSGSSFTLTKSVTVRP